MQDDDTANPGMLWVLDGEALWKTQGRRRRQGLRRLPWRCAREHEGRGGALSGLRQGARPAGQSGAAHQLCRAEHQQATPLAYESQELLALTAFVAQQSRGMPIATGSRPEACSRSSPKDANCSSSGRASSISPAPIATTTIGTSTLPAPPSRRRTRPAIRSTGWNGNRSARCSAACATASPACAPQPYDYGAPELVELELYLMSRARGHADGDAGGAAVSLTRHHQWPHCRAPTPSGVGRARQACWRRPRRQTRRGSR